MIKLLAISVSKLRDEVFLFEHNEKAYEVGVDTIASELVNIEDISTTISTVLKTIVMYKF